MTEGRGDGKATFSWARPAAEPALPVRGVRAMARQRLRDVSWFDVVVAVIITAVFDFVVGLLLSGYFGSRCQNVCTLHQQAHEDRMLLLLIPILLCAPPVLLALVMKRMRALIAVVQVIICVALLTHIALDLRTVRSHINGTAPCWTPLYTAKDCPWGPV